MGITTRRSVTQSSSAPSISGSLPVKSKARAPPSSPLPSIVKGTPLSPEKYQEKVFKKRKTGDAPAVLPAVAASNLVDECSSSDYTTLPFPKLPFSLKEAREHLIKTDIRFKKCFDNVELKTYLELVDGEVKELNVFSSLVTSILGQQISWKAARSIVYKFCRLFSPSLPEKPDFDLTPREGLPFPSPHAILRASTDELRSCGLSGAKVKYVEDIARRFATGNLDVRKLVILGEEQLIKELVEIKGVGVWTAQMFLMFALRMPNILPVGDLGIQRGMCIFFNSGREGPKIDESKKKGTNEDEGSSSSSVGLNQEVPPLPEDGPSISSIRSRLQGKKAKGNVYLTPSEMEILSAPWKPYRSVACLLMWPLVDQ